MARPGKIGSLPADVRDEVCRRLYNGETAVRILPWLNGREDVQKHLEANFATSAPISAQNLSEWRMGGYREWLARLERVQKARELSVYGDKLATSGKHIAGGAHAILSGKLLELLETYELDPSNPKEAQAILNAVSQMHAAEIEAGKLKLQTAKLEQDKQKLALETKKFQRTTAELFIKYCADDAARKVALSSQSKDVKLDKLVTLMFGKPDPEDV